MTGCALIDLADREHIEVTGSDRAAFLHNFCTQEIKRLPVGLGAEAFFTNIKGRILAHTLVFVGERAIWIDGPSGTARVLLPHLDRYLIAEDVQLADRTSDWGEIGLIGPQAAALVERLVPGSGAFVPGQHAHAGNVTVRRFDLTKSPGWLVGASRSELPTLAQRIAAEGAVPCSDEVFQALRIEAGTPQHGLDLSDDLLAQEAGRTKRAISFAKGCYLGQEPIARIDALGHTNRELRGLRLETAAVTPPGAKVFHPDTGAEVGQVTSAALSPLDSHGVALALLRREVNAPGTIVLVEINGQRTRAEVFWQT